MTTEDVRTLYWTEPFQPFQLVLKDGREILVGSRNHITIAVKGERITVCPRIEDFEIIDLPDVTGVRLLGPLQTGVPTPGAA